MDGRQFISCLIISSTGFVIQLSTQQGSSLVYHVLCVSFDFHFDLTSLLCCIILMYMYHCTFLFCYLDGNGEEGADWRASMRDRYPFPINFLIHFSWCLMFHSKCTNYRFTLTRKLFSVVFVVIGYLQRTFNLLPFLVAMLMEVGGHFSHN